MIKAFSKGPGTIKNSAIKSSTYTFKNFEKELFDEGKFNGEEIFKSKAWKNPR